ncbi:hypothetical protein FRC17_006437, partial [Serendipita sp. 399]
MSESGWERDPSLPPKPPPGTYPHPFPEARDDPHSNSMRTTYQHPPRMHASSRPSASSYSSVNASTSTSAGTSPMPNRYAALNQLSGLSFSEPDIMSSNLPPLYVIHVKASSNNTIITLHAPPTPKILDISSTLPLPSSGGGKVVGGSTPTRTRWDDPTPEKVASTFSVESNPDAVPVEAEQAGLGAADGQAEVVASTAAEEGEPKEDVGQDATTEAAAPTPAELPKQSVQIVAPPTANRCIGWASGGSCHYRKVQRSTYEAGHAASIRIIRRVEEAYRHLASGGKIEDIPPMKEVVKDARQERL